MASSSLDCNFSILGQESMGKRTKVLIPNSIWTKSYKVRGLPYLPYLALLTFIAEMEVKPIEGRPKRS